eukprot:198704-Rhodomonas_salina.2
MRRAKARERGGGCASAPVRCRPAAAVAASVEPRQFAETEQQRLLPKEMLLFRDAKERWDAAVSERVGI